MKQINVRYFENYTAGGKAKIDVYNILNQNGIESLDCYCSEKNNKRTKMINEVKKYLFLKKIKKENDTLFFQYPFSNISIVNKQLIKLEKRKKIIILIHDIESLRFGNDKRFKEEKEIFSNAFVVIAHNSKMREYLINYMNVSYKKIMVLELFDYLYSGKEIKIRKLGKKPYRICFAGNLSKKKAPFLYELQNKEDLGVIFSLYGIGYDMLERQKVIYNGNFTSDQLVEKIEADFGLIWDGEWENERFNQLKEYTKYNNPHKLSLYIVCRLPVIVWKESAIAEFVKKYHLGYLIENLDDIKKIDCDDNEYYILQHNIEQIRRKIINGEFLDKVLKKIMSNEEYSN